MKKIIGIFLVLYLLVSTTISGVYAVSGQSTEGDIQTDYSYNVNEESKINDVFENSETEPTNQNGKYHEVVIPTVPTAPTSQTASESAGITFLNAPVILGKGETSILNAQVSDFYSEAVTWTVDSNNIIEINKISESSVKIKAKNIGTATVTAMLSNGSGATCKVTVKNAPTSLKTYDSTLTLGVGETYIQGAVTNSNSWSNDFTWTSSNEAVAKVKKTVANKAEIIAVGVGEATINVKTYNGKTAKIKVNIKSAPSTITINNSSINLGQGDSMQIHEFTNSGTYAKTFDWSSSDSNIAVVEKLNSNKAVVKAVGTGQAVIKVKTYNNVEDECIVNVYKAPSSVKISESSLILGSGESITIFERTDSGSWAQNITWSSSDNSVATVSKLSGSKAKITAKSVGSAEIKIKTYNGKTASCKVTVKSAPSSVSVSQSSLTLGVGENYYISEKTNVGTYANAYNLKWTSSNSNVAVVEKQDKNKAKIIAKSTGTAKITVKLYNGKTATCQLTVKSAPKAVKIKPGKVEVSLGKSAKIYEVTNINSYAKNFTWQSSDDSIATVAKTTNNYATVTGKSLGKATITVTLYNGISASCEVTVTKAKIYLSPSDQNSNTYVTGNTNEMEQCYKIASAAKAALERNGFSVKMPSKKGQTMKDNVKESNSWGADIHIPIHTNGAYGNTLGTMIMVCRNKGEANKIANAILDSVGPITPGKDFAISERPDLYELNSTNSIAVYVEVEFHDNVTGAKWIINNSQKAGEAIAKGICDYYKVEFIETEEHLS